jgi:integrase
MAKRPVSMASTPVRDVAAEEEGKFLKLVEIAKLGAHVSREIERLAPLLVSVLGVPVERSSDVWRNLRRVSMVRALVRSGFRRFEFCGTVCGDFVDGPEPRLWTVGKGARRHYAPLPPPAADSIRQWLGFKRLVGEEVRPEAPLFCGRDGQFVSFEMLRQEWSRTLREAGLPPYTVHASRHTAGLIVLVTTGDIRKVGRFLRHEGISVTQRTYAHIDPAQLRRDLAAPGVWP